MGRVLILKFWSFKYNRDIKWVWHFGAEPDFNGEPEAEMLRYSSFIQQRNQEEKCKPGNFNQQSSAAMRRLWEPFMHTRALTVDCGAENLGAAALGPLLRPTLQSIYYWSALSEMRVLPLSSATVMMERI